MHEARAGGEAEQRLVENPGAPQAIRHEQDSAIGISTYDVFRLIRNVVSAFLHLCYFG